MPHRCPPAHHPRLRARLRWPLGLALWALLIGQWLSLVHGVVHPVPVAKGAVAVHAAAHPHEGDGTAWLARAVDGHAEGSLVCHLLDHLVQPAPVTPCWPAALASAPDGPPRQPSQPPAHATTHRSYHARAPPASA